MADDQPEGWAPSPHLLALITVSIVLLALAVVVGRADLLVLALPLVIAAAWSFAERPNGRPEVTAAVSSMRPIEGTTQQLTITATGIIGAEQWHAVVSPTAGVIWDRDRHHGSSLPEGDTDRCALTFGVRRWGPAEVGSVQVAATSPWGAFVWGPAILSGFALTAVPRTEAFRGNTPMPHPDGLVGLNRSRRPGDGSEFADIRPFRAGDKLRAVHWPVTTRTGALHVRTSYAEQDAEVALVLDASVDLRGRGTTDGSLDLGLRACASLSHYFLGRGDRVGLDVIGSGSLLHLPVSPGVRQHRRVLDVLSHVVVGRYSDRRPDRVRLRISPGAQVFVVTPLLTDFAAKVTADLARRGFSVVVIDCLPSDREPLERDELDALALRVRLLERSIDLDELAGRGIPITHWQGSGSLDQVLRALARRPPSRLGQR